MHLRIPIFCGGKRHHLHLDGGVLTAPDHDTLTLALLIAMKNPPRCGDFLRRSQNGAYDTQGWYSMTHNRPLLRVAFDLITNIVRPIQHTYWTAGRLIADPFFLLTPSPLHARLAFGIPPTHPLLLWQADPDPTTGLEWNLAPDWRKAFLTPKDTGLYIWGHDNECHVCQEQLNGTKAADHTHDPQHRARCEDAAQQILATQISNVSRLA